DENREKPERTVCDIPKNVVMVRKCLHFTMPFPIPPIPWTKCLESLSKDHPGNVYCRCSLLVVVFTNRRQSFCFLCCVDCSSCFILPYSISIESDSGRGKA